MFFVPHHIKYLIIMVIKTAIISSLLLFNIYLFNACKKKPVVNPNISTDYTHFKGGFYVKKIYGYGYASSALSVSYKDTSDLTVQVHVDDDTIRIFDYTFKIDSFNQSSFSVDRPNSIGGIEELRLDYYNNYDSIQITSYSTDNYSIVLSKSCRGVRKASASSNISDGWYNFVVKRKEVLADIDTQYMASVMVTVDETYDPLNSGKTQLTIENNTLIFKNFYSYLIERNLQTNWFSSASTRKISRKRIYWKNDSLYIDYLLMNEDTSFPPVVDTIHYSYKGRKQ